MKRIVLLLIPIFLFVHSALSQDWALQRLEKSPRHREWVGIKHDGRTVETLVVYPEAKGKRPVVLVIHEIFGLSEWAQELADELADAGYIAVAPDLLSGKGPNGGRTSAFANEDKVIEAIRGLNPDDVTADLSAAADYGLKLPAASGKLFVTGFCWGGGQSFRFATNRPDLKAAFVFYGTPPADGMDRIKAPVYGFYGGNDARVTATVDPTKEKMKTAGKKYDPVVYEGAGHGFMRGGEDPTTTAPSHPADIKARDEAWKVLKSVIK